jgi:hypothetical protein
MFRIIDRCYGCGLRLLVPNYAIGWAPDIATRYEAAKRVVVNPAEAKTVRMIFQRYLAVKSFQKLIDELNAKGIGAAHECDAWGIFRNLALCESATTFWGKRKRRPCIS